MDTVYKHNLCFLYPQCHVYTLQLAIYQVTDDRLCDELLSLFNRSINVTMLVSANVIPVYNHHKAKVSITHTHMHAHHGYYSSHTGVLQEALLWRDAGESAEFLFQVCVQS